MTMAHIHIGLDEGRVRCYRYRDSNPILDVSTGSTALMISVHNHPMGITPDVVQLARDLARAAEQYASEMERRYEEQRPKLVPTPLFGADVGFGDEMDPGAVVPPAAVDPDEAYIDNDGNTDFAVRSEP